MLDFKLTAALTPKKDGFSPCMTGKTLEIFLIVLWHGFPVMVVCYDNTANTYADGTQYLKYLKTGILQYK